jgi:ribose transport system substrate-binding protein
VKSIKIAGIAGVTAAALLLVACSSSGGVSSGSGGDSPGSTGSSTRSQNADVTAALAAAKANVEAHTQLPTTMPSSYTPLPSAPPTKDANGKPYLVVFLQCEQNQCANQGNGIEAAAKAIGWQFKRLNFQQANPATLVSALKSALQFNNAGNHLVGAFFSGPQQQLYQSVLNDYAKAGAFVSVSYADKAPSGPGTVPAFGYDDDQKYLGTLLADAQITHANGVPSKSILVTVSQYPVFAATVQGYKDELAKVCPSCQVELADATLQQLASNQLNQVVVSAAQRNKDAKYIVSVNGSFIAQLPQALKSAGLDGKFQIISGQGISLDQQNVLNGSQLYTSSSPHTYGGWQDVDIAVRTVMKLPIPDADHTDPTYLLTKDNIGTPRDSFDVPTDYSAQFKKLWLVG